jgi:hypothetical protein
LGYFLPQLGDAFFDGILHDRRLAGIRNSWKTDWFYDPEECADGAAIGAVSVSLLAL